MDNTNTTTAAGTEATHDTFDSAIEAAFEGLEDTGAVEDTNSGDAAAASAEQAAAVEAAGDTTGETTGANADEANASPDQWSQEDEAALAALSPEVRDLFDRRIKAIEAEHTGKASEVAADVELGKGIRSIVDEGGFRDILKQSGMNEVQGVQYLANLDRFAREKPADYLRFVANHVRERFGLDPAKELGLSGDQTGASLDDAFQDPRVPQLERQLGTLTSHIQNEAQQRQAASIRQTIETFKTAKDAAGNLLHPHHEEVAEDMAAFIRADPRMTLESAYERAVWSNPAARQKVQQAEREAADKKAKTEAANAAKAARANVRSGNRSMAATPNVETIDDAVNAAFAELNG